MRWGDIGFKSQSFHAVAKHLVALRIAGVTNSDAAFLLEFSDRLMERGYNMRRRGKAPFAAVLFHHTPLIVEVKRERSGVSFAGFKSFNASNDEGKARYALNAFIGRRDEKINADFRNIDINAAKRTHGIDNEKLAGIFDHFADGFNVIENTSGRFTMHHCDHGHIGVLF